jgi:hypothetical protein
MFWRPWAIKRENALFALALFGLIISSRRRFGLLLAIPYVCWLPAPWRGWTGLRAASFQVSVHAAGLAGKVFVGLREGTIVL